MAKSAKFLVEQRWWEAQKNCVHLGAACATVLSVILLKVLRVFLLPSTGESGDRVQLQKDKLVAVSSVVALAHFAWGQNVSCRSSVITAVALKSIVLTAALHKCKDRVLLLWWGQGLRRQQKCPISNYAFQIRMTHSKMDSMWKIWRVHQ